MRDSRKSKTKAGIAFAASVVLALSIVYAFDLPWYATWLPSSICGESAAQLALRRGWI